MVQKNRAICRTPTYIPNAIDGGTERKKPDRELEKSVLDGRLRPRGDGELESLIKSNRNRRKRRGKGKRVGVGAEKMTNQKETPQKSPVVSVTTARRSRNVQIKEARAYTYCT